ncbi:transmembrane 4 L6 family member 20 isoform X2 [Pleurodeles waltl]|uniref:transmembrane 4 L6 family member 20 isoform X2 n=1 Tax=Pleurodeles waltl TaxID=8319 RepID=UPI0037096425
MTCCEGWTSCNGFTLLVLSILAICFNLTLIIIDYSEDGRLLHYPTSWYEWFLPGILGGGLLVLPAVSMTLAARKRGSCNSRCGMVTSSFLSLLGILGAVYCCLISIFAIAEGPLICKEGNKDVSSCDFSLGNLSSFYMLNFDLDWFTNGTCLSALEPPVSNGTRLANIQDRIPALDIPSFDIPRIEINEELQKILHLTVFVGLSVVGIVEILVSVSQVLAGLMGFLCGTSKKKRNRAV